MNIRTGPGTLVTIVKLLASSPNMALAAATSPESVACLNLSRIDDWTPLRLLYRAPAQLHPYVSS